MGLPSYDNLLQPRTKGMYIFQLTFVHLIQFIFRLGTLFVTT
jgi:hypothetical protein